MSISLKTHKMLWGRAGSKCAFPGCRKDLVVDATETDDESVVGEECHIIARKSDGARGVSDLTEEQRDKYDNLVMMCNVHHKVIDDQPGEYTVQRLKEIKKAHEQWVKQSLEGYDETKQRDDELYTFIIEKWASLCDLERWEAWSSYVLGSGQPSLSMEMDTTLKELKGWLFSRIWPRRYREVESAFENFRRVLADFLNTFHEYSEIRGDRYWTEKIYRREHEDHAFHTRLYHEYEFHVALVEDLMMELTRAANYVCDQTRKFIWPTYRLQEGLLISQSGPHMDMTFRSYRLEYRDAERNDNPYPGLDEFKLVRKNRDFHFGIGADIDDPEFQEWIITH